MEWNEENEKLICLYGWPENCSFCMIELITTVKQLGVAEVKS